MKLLQVEILNYRSIQKQTIKFENKCQVLVGINESGKSNVLNALATLSNKHKTSPGDERQNLPDEPETLDPSRIRFLFTLEKSDHEAIAEKVTQVAYVKPTVKLLNNGTKDITLAQFVKTFGQSLYDVDIRTGTKSASYWDFDRDTYSLVGEVVKASSVCPSDYVFVNSDGESINIADRKFLKLSPEEKEKIPEEYLVGAEPKDVFFGVTLSLVGHVKSNLPSVVYWAYSDKDLLPTHVSLSKFEANPGAYTPLKNMFELAGINDIPAAIKREKAKGSTQLNNLLRRVSLRSTDYLQAVWKEYRDVKFSLQMDGTNIRCTISEENDFPFADRSDGFKKFIAFLLSVSSTSHTGSLSNALVLIDEPETGLHPSGARYLRDELLKVALNNYVIYSTHSIFMIDRHNLSRHLIVRKERETTTLTTGTMGNIVDEEVIFNAVNYSTFEHLKEKNILLEGWRDRKLLEVFTRTYERAFFSSIGIIHGRGAPSFRTLVPTLELAERKAVIVSDNDTPAKSAQKTYNELRYQTQWLTYKEISNTTTANTGEDFVKSDVLADKFKTITTAAGNPVVLAASDLPQDDKLNFLKGKLLQHGISEDDAKVIIEDFKRTVFDNLTKNHIEDRYKKLVDDIKKYLETTLA